MGTGFAMSAGWLSMPARFTRWRLTRPRHSSSVPSTTTPPRRGSAPCSSPSHHWLATCDSRGLARGTQGRPDTGTINENLLLRASVLTPHRLLPPYTSSPTFRSAPEEFGHRVDERARASDQRVLDPRGGSLPRRARRLRCDLVVAQTDPATQAADSRRRKRPEDASPSNRYPRWMDCDRFPAFGPSVTIGRACGTCARGRARNATQQVHLVSPAQPTIRCPRASRSRTAGCPWSR